MKFNIREITNKADFDAYLPELVKLMVRFHNSSGSPIDISETLDRLYHYFDCQWGANVFFITDAEKRNLVGYCFSQIAINNGVKELFIWQVYIAENGALVQGINFLKDWALKNDCRKMYFLTRRNPEAYSRLLTKHGFHKASVLFEADI